MMKKIAMVLTVALVASVSMSATMFTTNFGAGYDTYLDASGSYTIGEGYFKTNTNAYMVLAETKDSDYVSADWVLTATYATLGNRDYENITAGIGDPDAGWRTLPNANSLYTYAAKSWRNKDAAVVSIDSSTTVLEEWAGATAYGGTITITKIGDNITFEQARAGVTYTSATYSISTVAPYLDDTNSKLFVTTSDPDAWITSMSVTVPEPMTMSMVLVGSVLTLIRKKRECIGKN